MASQPYSFSEWFVRFIRAAQLSDVEQRDLAAQLIASEATVQAERVEEVEVEVAHQVEQIVEAVQQTAVGATRPQARTLPAEATMHQQQRGR